MAGQYHANMRIVPTAMRGSRIPSAHLHFEAEQTPSKKKAAWPGRLINRRRWFRTVDRINNRQVYRGYHVTEVVDGFPERLNNAMSHMTYHHCAVRMTKGYLYMDLIDGIALVEGGMPRGCSRARACILWLRQHQSTVA
jgi:hypothetical protein